MAHNTKTFHVLVCVVISFFFLNVEEIKKNKREEEGKNKEEEKNKERRFGEELCRKRGWDEKQGREFEMMTETNFLEFLPCGTPDTWAPHLNSDSGFPSVRLLETASSDRTLNPPVPVRSHWITTLRVVSIWMGNHLGNRVLLAFTGPNQAGHRVNVSRLIACHRMVGKTPITKHLNS
jgi:hypothetical protein